MKSLRNILLLLALALPGIAQTVYNVELTWTPGPNNPGGTLTDIYRVPRDVPCPATPAAGVVKITATPVPGMGYVDMDVQPVGACYYAKHVAPGNFESVFSAPARVFGPLSPPQGLDATTTTASAKIEMDANGAVLASLDVIKTKGGAQPTESTEIAEFDPVPRADMDHVQLIDSPSPNLAARVVAYETGE